MNPRALRPAIALAAAGVLAVLTGCTAQPVSTPAAGTTAQAASAQEFACPTLAEVAALTATPFTTRTAGSSTCDYATGTDASDTDAGTDPAAPATVVVARQAASDTRTAAALRAAAMRRGAATADASALAFDAFTASTATSCTAWFPGIDGALTSVVARQDGTAGKDECGVATAVATLVGAGSSSAPTVAVLASDRLLGTRTKTQIWPWLIGRDAHVRIDRVAVAGSLRPGSSGSFASAAKTIPASSAAVVLVSGAAEAGASRLEVLSAASAALSAASGRAPKAKLLVVGPVAGANTSFEDLEVLRASLRSAAAIAGATYIDPSTDVAAASGTPAALAAVSGSITTSLRTVGVAQG